MLKGIFTYWLITGVLEFCVIHYRLNFNEPEPKRELRLGFCEKYEMTEEEINRLILLISFLCGFFLFPRLLVNQVLKCFFSDEE